MQFRYTKLVLALVIAAVVAYAVQDWAAGEAASLAEQLIGIGVLVLITLLPIGLLADLAAAIRRSVRGP